MPKFWNFRADATEPEDGVLDVRGVLVVDDNWFIDGAVSARDFREQLAKYRNVTVLINSPGGDVMAGAEMYTALREHSTSGRGKVTVKVTALAASAASVVAMAGDEVLMSPVAYMMVHNPWSVIAGNADDMRHEADVLDEIAEGIINAYQIKTGKSRAKLKELMEAESYMDARRCVKEGFADGLLGRSEVIPEERDPDGNNPDQEDPEEDGVMMRAADFGLGRAVACARAHGMKLNPLRTFNFPGIDQGNKETLEEEIRKDIERRASMIASLF